MGHLTKKIQVAEVLATLALAVKVVEYSGKQVPWWSSETFAPFAGFLSFLSGAFLLASVVLWLNSSSKKLALVDEIATEVREIKDELRRLESCLAEKSLSNLELEELFRFRPDKINADQMRNVWITLLWRVRERYWATNYIKDADIYLKGYAESAMAIQAAKIKAQAADIRKVFIVQDEAERQKMEPIFKKQRDLGISVRYILYSVMKADASLDAKAAQLDTFDFGLIDARTTLLWFLKKDRCVDSGQVVVGSKELAPYQDFFHTLYTEATPYT